jgi:iron(III) transport system ATP-binding protein
VQVRLDNITKRFGDTTAVNKVTLDIGDGELFFLLGPSGCGKTTVMRMVAGFYIPDEGRIFFDNDDVSHLPPHKRDTGMVFQSYALWPHMTVRENVAFGLELRKLTKEQIKQRTAEALAMVKMTERAEYRPNQLSGGQQQRVALARALVIHPKCLLLDEPLSNLDAKLRLEMRTEIRRICKEAKLTAIYVTHDQKEALSIADRLAVMNAGEVIQVGAPREVYLRPHSAFVANFIGETNFIEGTVAHVEKDRVEVKTSVGDVISTVLPVQPQQVGSKVTLSLRPEVIRLGDAPSGAPNIFDGTVHDTIYLGEVAQHVVNLGSNGSVALKVFELNPRYVARDDTKLSAKVWVKPEDVVVLTK